MSMNPFVGWSITSLLLWMLNKKSGDSSSDTANEPDALNASPAQVGTPVPVVMGRTLLKSPLIIYYGDFSATPYTETYSAHASFSAWPLVFALIAQVLAMPATGVTNPGQPVTTTGGGGSTSGPGTNKDTSITPLINALFTWLLMWLINGRNLKTTIQKGFKYRLGYQMLACMSGTDIRLRGVYLKEQKVWEGNVTREDHPAGPFVIPVNNEELFGGPDEDGGFVGELHMYLGGPDQPADPWMVNQMMAETVQEELRGLTPAYRPFISIVVPTAYVGKQASIPETWLDLQYIPNRLGLGAIGDDANPMEVIYEMHVNVEWGLNRSPDLIDAESMIAVGQKLKTEGLGITVPVSSKTEVRQLIDDICDHLDMVRYTDPETGKLTFKLIRNDYDAANLPVFDENICSSVEYTRTVWSNTNGSICAAYTDSVAQYEGSTVTVNDPANIEMNAGNCNSEDCDFKYFTTAGNARWGAQRELRQQAFPLAAATLICNRKGAFVRPGDVIKLNWPPYGIKDLILRVTDVGFGDFVKGEITVECVEDVFGMGKSKFSPSDSTEWVPPKNYPTGVQLFKYFEAPWEMMQVKDSFVFAMAARPDNQTQKWTIWRYRDLTWETTNGMIKWTPVGQLLGDYLETGDMEDTTGFEVLDVGGVEDLAKRMLATGTPGFSAARNGARLLMVDNEIMGWGNLTQLPNGHWRVQNVIRATFDTVPANHAQGATVYFMDAGYYANVTTGGAVSPPGYTTTESYNITTATADGVEEFDAAKVTNLTTKRRPERPNPPGRIRLSTHLQASVPYIARAAGDINLSWVLRNKQQSYGCVAQDDTSDFFSGLAIHPVQGLQTVIRVYAGSEKIRETMLDASVEETVIVDGLETTQTRLITDYTYSWGQRCLDKPAFTLETRIEIAARLSNLESYQLHSRTFTWKPPYLFGGCANAVEAQALIQASWQDGGVVVRFPDETQNRRIEVADMPVIILGDLYVAQQPGSIPCAAGWLIPNGTILAVTGNGNYETMNLSAGFILLSYYTPEATASLSAWQYDGVGFTRIAIPA